MLERAEKRDLAIQCLKSGETIPQMEACLRLPKDAERYVIVAGQPLELGAEPCMLFTFADLEDRHKAEIALVQSEERFAKSFRLSPVPTVIGTTERPPLPRRQRRLREGDGLRHGRGDRPHRGRPAAVGRRAVRRRFEADLAKSGSVRGFEAKFHPKGGGEIDCLVSAETVTINDRLLHPVRVPGHHRAQAHGKRTRGGH